MNKSLFPLSACYGSFRGKQAEIKELVHTQHEWFHTVNNNQHIGCFHYAVGKVPATLLISAIVCLAKIPLTSVIFSFLLLALAVKQQLTT